MGSALLLALLLTGLLSPAGTPLFAQSGWSPVSSGTTATLNRIAWPAMYGTPAYPGTLLVAGDSGKFLQSEDGGASWTSPPFVPTGADFNAPVFPYPDTGYVVGDSGTVYRVVRVGDQYQFFLPTSVPATSNLNCVTSVPLTVSGFAAGDNGTILRTTTRGQTWVAQNSQTTRNINSIRMPTVTRIFACGDSGLILRSFSSGNWVTLPVGGAYATTRFNAIVPWGTLGDTALVVGQNGTILRSRNAGSPTPTWFTQESGVTVTLRGIYFNGGMLWVVGDSGVVLHSTNSGDTWNLQESGTTENLRDILFADAIHGCIVGENGTLLRTTTGGEYRPITCSPDPLEFGPVIIGSTRAGILTLRNSSDLPVGITLASSTNPLFDITPSSATIPAHGKQTFSVAFSPLAKSVDSAAITIEANGGEIELSVQASGMGVDSLEQPAWSWLNPQPQGTPLTDIGFFDALNGIAVGEAGTVIRTSDGGESWTTAHYTAGINTSLLALDILDAQNAVAVGENGLILLTSDRGANWSIPPTLGPIERLVGASFSGTDTGYVVGWNGSLDDLQSGSIYRTTDGGATWDNQMPSFSRTTGETVFDIPVSIAAVTPDVAIAVGFMVYVSPGYISGFIYRTTDGGGHWSGHSSASLPLRAVTFMDASTGIAVGDGGTILRTINGGIDWSPVLSPTFADLIDVAFTGPNDGIAISIYGTSLTTNDGGVSWIPRTVSGISSWKAVAFANPDLAIAVVYGHYDGPADPPPTYLGVQQALYSTTDGGTTWENLSESFETNSLRGVSFKDAENGVAISDRGGILKTTDGGANWRRLTEGSLLAFVRHPLTSVCYFQPDNIIIAGMYGTVLHSPDGGTSWVEQSSGTTATLYAVSFESPNFGYIVGGDGMILRTTDTGDHWASQTTSLRNEFRGVDLFDAASAVVVGSSGTILRTSDAGRNWSAVPGGTSQTFYDVSVQGVSGVAVGDGGAIARTTDGGETWHAAISGTAAPLLGVLLSGSGTGTAVGDGGTILRTADAGATWTVTPSGTPVMLYDVAFVDDLVGTVVGGAGVMLRTVTGGMQSNEITDAPVLSLPASYRLEQNYPNPFNPVTTIRYSLPAESRVVLKIYDVLGRVVATLVDAVQQSGEQSAAWDARGMASGVYVYRLEAAGLNSTGDQFTRDIRMVLVR